MDAHQPGSAEAYHTATSYSRNRMQGHYLDWANQPLPYKTYTEAPTTPLPTDIDLPQDSLWNLAAQPHPAASPGDRLDLQQLASICALTHGFTAQRQVPGQTFLYRNVASAGALYPAELYVAASRIEGLDPGLFYYDIREFALKSLRPGMAMEAIFGDGTMAMDPRTIATFLITGIFFRSAWKYRARALRYVLLDSGHLLENLRNALSAFGLDFVIDYDYGDTAVNRLLDLDVRREAVFACVSLRGSHTAEPGETLPGPPLSTSAESSATEDYDIAAKTIYYNEN